MEKIEDKVHRFKCPSCGADLLFEPKDGALVCPYCQHKEIIPETAGAVEELDYQRYLTIRPEELVMLAPNALEVDCKRCGAQVTFTPPDVAGTCSFCGAAIVTQPVSADPMLCPNAVLPFHLDKNAATEQIQKWISSRWFAPNALKRFATPGAINGVYIPFWTYDAYTTSDFTGERGDYYYETEYYTERDADGNNVQRSRQVRRIRWSYSSGTTQRWFDDVLIPATKSLPNDKLQELEPWDLHQLKPYEPSYLAGYKAQRYQVVLTEGFERAKQFMAAVIDTDVRNQIGGNEQRVLGVRTHYSALTFKHVLLPVYVGAYHLRDKLFQVVVNARTGEVQGERPYSWVKIGLLVIFVVSIIAALVYWYDSHSIMKAPPPSGRWERSFLIDDHSVLHLQRQVCI